MMVWEGREKRVYDATKPIGEMLGGALGGWETKTEKGRLLWAGYGCGWVEAGTEVMKRAEVGEQWEGGRRGSEEVKSEVLTCCVEMRLGGGTRLDWG